MIPCQIREYGAVHMTASHARLLDPDRAGLNRTRRGTVFDKIGQQMRILRSIRRSETRRHHGFRITGTEGADHRTAARHGLSQPLGNRRFTIGAGHGQHAHFFAGVAVNLLGNRAHQCMQLTYGNHRSATKLGGTQRQIIGPQHCTGAIG